MDQQSDDTLISVVRPHQSSPQNLLDSEVRDAFNHVLSMDLDVPILTLEIGYQKIRTRFDEIGYEFDAIPPFMAQVDDFEEGEDIHAILDGTDTILCYLHIGYFRDIGGWYEIYAECVTEDELNEILSSDLEG